MKNQLVTLLVLATIAINGCHTSSSSTTVTPTTPVSTFNITINGHSYHLSSNANSNPPIVVRATTLSVAGEFMLSFGGTNTNQVGTSFTGLKSDLSSPLGTYIVDSSHGSNEVEDYGDGSKIYIGNHSSGGTATVTICNGTECKGTFNVNLSYNNITYPVTGDFDYKH